MIQHGPLFPYLNCDKMSSTPALVASDITAFFSGIGGSLLDRPLNLGGDIGGNEIVTSLLYNFAPDVSRDVIGPVGTPPGQWAMYYPFYIINKHTETTVSNVTIWIYRAMSDPNLAIGIGFDPAGKNGIIQTIPNQLTAPTGVTFKSPFTEASTTALKIDTLAPGDKQGIWVKQFGNKGIRSIAQASYGIKWSFALPATDPVTP
jgi:hypothetical protein